MEKLKIKEGTRIKFWERTECSIHIHKKPEKDFYVYDTFELDGTVIKLNHKWNKKAYLTIASSERMEYFHSVENDFNKWLARD